MSQNLSLPQLDELLRDLEANDLLHIRGFTENKDFKMRWSEFLEGITDSFGDSFVKFTINNQGLDAIQRQNARTNIQALAKDVADTHLGTLTNNGQLIINAAQALLANTGTDGSASNNVVNISNNLGGGMKMSGRGGVKFRSRGDSTTAYSIAEFQNNSSVETTVFGILGTNGYTQVGIPASPSAAVLFDVFGKVRHVDATEADESATLGQVQALVAGAGSNYDAFLEFNELTDLWQVGFADDFLQFFEGVFSFNYTGGLSLEIGNDAVNDWFEFVSSAGILGYNFDKPVRVNGAELVNNINLVVAVENEVAAVTREPDLGQFGEDGGFAFLRSIFRTKTFTSIDFISSSEHGSEILPIYSTLSVTRDPVLGVPPRNKNQSIVYHSSASIPDILGAGKPAWLTLLGDTYLTGFANINELTFTYHKFYAGQKNIVTCEIQALTGANEDPDAPTFYDSRWIGIFNFNENKDLVGDNEFLNEAVNVNSNLFPLEAVNPANAVYTDLGSGDYAISTGDNATPADRFYGSFAMTQASHDLLTNDFTMVIRLRKRSGFDDDTILWLVSNKNDTVDVNTGFAIYMNSNTDFRLRVGNNNYDTISAFVPGQVLSDDVWWTFAFKYSATNGYSLWAKSSGASYPLTQLRNNVATAGQSLNNELTPLRMAFGISSSSNPRRGHEYDHLRIAMDSSFTDAEIEAVINEIEP